jgi:hypothetical protein
VPAQPELPRYRKHEKSPNVGPAGGIAVYSAPVASGVFAVHGAFAVPAARAARFPGHILNAAVLLLRGPYPATWSVGSGELLFADDATVDGGLIRGYFNVDLFDVFNLMLEPNLYRVSASIFEHISEIVSVEVQPV